MKKLIISIIACLIAIAVQANTIQQDGVYVTVSSRHAGTNGYGNYLTAGFSLSEKKEVTVHVQITDSKTGSVVKDTWVTLKPNSSNEATAFFSALPGRGPYIVKLIQH